MKWLCLIGIFFPFLGWTQFSDSFDDGDFSQKPAWEGDTSHFEINQSLQLHLKSTGTDTSALFTSNGKVQHTEWTFWLKVSFNTSVNNYSRVYFVSDSREISKITAAYYLQIGGSDDSIAVVRQTGTENKKIFSIKNYKTNKSINELRIKITSDSLGNFEMHMDTSGGFNYIRCGSYYDNMIAHSKWFGVFCKYTSSNSTRFLFDDFYVGPVRHDTIPPRVIARQLFDPRTFLLEMSEPISEEAARETRNYLLKDRWVNPDSVVLGNDYPTKIFLYFNSEVEDGDCDSLYIKGIEDLETNVIHDTILSFCNYHPKTYDIVINEIFADPEPQVGLPVAEFVELYNVTSFPLNLNGWQLICGSNRKTFPPVEIEPHGFLIISKDTVYSNYGHTEVLFSSSSTISNEGSMLVLQDQQLHVIHALAWEPGWFNGSFKAEGGWSLEMIDPGNPCGCGENWAPSINEAGGTPGIENSVADYNPDRKNPLAVHSVFADSMTIEIKFSEALDSLSVYRGLNTEVQPGDKKPDSLICIRPLYQSVRLHFSQKFETGVEYTLRFSGAVTDCSGNHLDSNHTLRFAIPSRVTHMNLVINEIMPDPVSDGERFIEILNASDKVIDLKSVIVAGRDTVTGILPGAASIANSGFLLFPGDYYVLTGDRDHILTQYRCPDPNAIHDFKGLAGMGNDSGTVVLAREDDLGIIDRVSYRSEMHHPLLVNREGVSLERFSSNWPSNDPSNWHSASETAGFATPGYLNSHGPETFEVTSAISTEPETFSPDNDGYQDYMNIRIEENQPGFSVTAIIFDIRGRIVKRLINNVLGESTTTFLWDGTTDSGHKSPTGIHIVQVELVWPDGKVKKLKKSFVLAGKF